MRKAYIPELDALRAIAVTAVAFSHWAPQELLLNIPWGNMGVQLFFVLSGFLITGILLDARTEIASPAERMAIIRSFFVRRALRIFPIYYITILLAALIDVLPFREMMFWNLFYLSNIFFFLRQDFLGSASHLWTLAVEEQFYILWPWAMLFLPRRLLSYFMTAVILVAIIFELGAAVFFPQVQLIGVLPITAFGALAAGGMLALYDSNSAMREKYISLCLTVAVPAFIVGIVAIAAGIEFKPIWVAYHFSAIFTFVWIIARASEGFSGVAGALLSNKALVSIGKVSYGIYLFHNLAQYVVFKLAAFGFLPGFLTWGIGDFVVKTAITVGGAYLSWFVVERPIQRLKSYFPYVPKRTAASKLVPARTD